MQGNDGWKLEMHRCICLLLIFVKKCQEVLFSFGLYMKKNFVRELSYRKTAMQESNIELSFITSPGSLEHPGIST